METSLNVSEELKEVRDKYVGKPCSKEALLDIERRGFGVSTSSASGLIADVFEIRVCSFPNKVLKHHRKEADEL